MCFSNKKAVESTVIGNKLCIPICYGMIEFRKAYYERKFTCLIM